MDLSNNIVAKSILAATENLYKYKDAKKFKDITKFISRGRPGSSSHAYALALAPITNTGEYTSDDIVGISVNGGYRLDRMLFDRNEVLLAIQARATIVTDDGFARARVYNIGERELAEFLEAMNYEEQQGPDTGFSGIWKPKDL